MSGWIKVHRELMDKPIWIDSTPEQKTILITLLMMANHTEKEWEWKGDKYKASPGQFVTSLEKIASKSGKGISIQNVRTAINRFKKYEFLTDESTNKNRLITIVNWGFYQSKENDTNKQDDKQLTGNQQATNKQLTTNKNDKNEEELKTLRARYDSSQLEIIDRYFQTLSTTRKTGKLSPSIILNELKYWTRYDSDVVIHALEIHMRKSPEKREEYTRGIIRRVSEEGIKPFAVPEKKKKKTVDELIQRHRWPLVGG